MTPEYKAYIGPVILDIIEQMGSVEVQEIGETGRTDTFVLQADHCITLKYSSKRLPPWRFTFPKHELVELLQLRRRYPNVHVGLVCGRDGVVVLSIAELIGIIDRSQGDQCWVRVARRPGHMYGVAGNAAAADRKFPSGVEALVESMRARKSARSQSASSR
jgi:hypothetical protein